MASNSKKTQRIRDRKSKPNKQNLKGNLKRIQQNADILRELSSNKET